jgi:hypothetical protein
MLPDSLNIPELSEPYAAALMACLEHVFGSYEVVGIVATGTIIRGTGDLRSDLDIHVLHAGSFRERVQLFFNGVPCEIFVNPPHRVPAYFEEDKIDRRPVAPHMYATGVIVFDPLGSVAKLVAEAKTILESPPAAPNSDDLIAPRYGIATEFEDVEDLADRDRAAAAVMLGSVVVRLAQRRVAEEPGWLPRNKDLMPRLRVIDAMSADLAEAASSFLPFENRLAAAKELCRRVTGHTGFFEWTSPRETV